MQNTMSQVSKNNGEYRGSWIESNKLVSSLYSTHWNISIMQIEILLTWYNNNSVIRPTRRVWYHIIKVHNCLPILDCSVFRLYLMGPDQPMHIYSAYNFLSFYNVWIPTSSSYIYIYDHWWFTAILGINAVLLQWHCRAILFCLIWLTFSITQMATALRIPLLIIKPI